MSPIASNRSASIATPNTLGFTFTPGNEVRENSYHAAESTALTLDANALAVESITIKIPGISGSFFFSLNDSFLNAGTGQTLIIKGIYVVKGDPNVCPVLLLESFDKERRLVPVIQVIKNALGA